MPAYHTFCFRILYEFINWISPRCYGCSVYYDNEMVYDGKCSSLTYNLSDMFCLDVNTDITFKKGKNVTYVFEGLPISYLANYTENNVTYLKYRAKIERKDAVTGGIYSYNSGVLIPLLPKIEKTIVNKEPDTSEIYEEDKLIIPTWLLVLIILVVIGLAISGGVLAYCLIKSKSSENSKKDNRT